jgi:[acyl-carrier-protein] S-malonyltransferase
MRIGFVFPGQGSQSLGMSSELASDFAVVRKTYEVASQALGYDLWQLVQVDADQRLGQTQYTQPALLAASYAVWQVWRQKSQHIPAILAGHSLGEYTALVCAEAISFTDAIKLVAERGRLMQEAVPEGVGAMAAIVGLSDEQVEALCFAAQQQQLVSPANYNAYGQVVVAGHKSAVEQVVELAKQQGAKLAKLIPVSVPSHCALMQEAAQRLAVSLGKVAIHTPKIPVLNNVAVVCNTHPDDIRQALVQQLAKPVQWVKTIEYFAQDKIALLIECGPGKVLTGLNKRIIADIPTLAVNNSSSLQEALATL